MAHSDPNTTFEPEMSKKQNSDGSDLNEVDSAESGGIGETARIVDHAAERALCRKFDFRLLPVLALMCKSTFVWPLNMCNAHPIWG